MMKSSFEETNIPGLYDWKQKIGFFVQFMSFVIFLICFILNMIKRIDTKWLFLVLVVFIGAIVCMIIFGGMIIGS